MRFSSNHSRNEAGFSVKAAVFFVTFVAFTILLAPFGHRYYIEAKIKWALSEAASNGVAASTRANQDSDPRTTPSRAAAKLSTAAISVQAAPTGVDEIGWCITATWVAEGPQVKPVQRGSC